MGQKSACHNCNTSIISAAANVNAAATAAKNRFAIAAFAAFAELLPQTQCTIGKIGNNMPYFQPLTFNLNLFQLTTFAISEAIHLGANMHSENEESEEFCEDSPSNPIRKLHKIHSRVQLST